MNLNRLPRAHDMVRGGPPLDRLRLVFPVNFNPAVSGYNAPVGTIAMSANGLAAFEKWNTPLTGWFRTSVLGTLMSASTGLFNLLTLDYVVANAFDPAATGLFAKVGSRCTTLDGTKAWAKTGAADKQWLPVHGVQVALGADALEWVVAGLACDTLGGFRLAYRLAGKTANTAIGIRINETSAGGAAWKTPNRQTVITAGYYDTEANLGTRGGTFTVATDLMVGTIECLRPESAASVRIVEVRNTWIRSGDVFAWETIKIPFLAAGGEIVSVGFLVLNTARLDGALCTATLERVGF